MNVSIMLNLQKLTRVLSFVKFGCMLSLAGCHRWPAVTRISEGIMHKCAKLKFSNLNYARCASFE